MLLESDNTYNQVYTTYASNCRGVSSIFNPNVGRNTNMLMAGYFDYIPSSQTISFPQDNPFEEWGGLSKTTINDGAIYCLDASTLFSMTGGGVSLRLNLPHSITNGIYQPLESESGLYLQDYIIWGVNLGQYYITQPGLYAAFTPSGIEFTIISSAGKFTILDTTSNIQANTDFVIEFVWMAPAYPYDDLSQIAIIVNHNQTAIATIAVNSGPSNSLENLPFWALDSPTASNGLIGILRRLEIYYRPEGYLYNIVTFSSSSSFTSEKSLSSTSSSSSSSVRGNFALEFNHPNPVNFAVCAYNPSFFTSPYTMETWFKLPTGYSLNGQYMFSCYDGINGFGTYFVGTNLTFFVSNGGVETTIAYTSNVQDNAWHHLAITYNGTMLTMYVDLINVGSVLAATPGNPGLGLTLGNSSGLGNPLVCILDEFRISNIVRTITLSTSFTVDGNTLVYWEFNEGYGNAVLDESGHGNTLVLGGSPLPTWVAGR